MDNLDDSENTAKVSDSAYSNSCSNSQSRRSHSSKSTHSGSNSSGSSGYRGKPSTSGSSNQPQQKRVKEKEPKKKKQFPTETVGTHIDARHLPPDPVPEEPPPKEVHDVDQTPSLQLAHLEKDAEKMDIASPDTQAQDDDVSCSLLAGNTPVNSVSQSPNPISCSDGFSCVISMHDGVVMYTTSLLTTTLGFPKDMWIGRSFIDFIHPKDRNTFASQISSGLAVPKSVDGAQENVQTSADSVSTVVCRIRRYRRLGTGFCVKETVVTFMPFLLKLSFKSANVEEEEVIYLVVQATPFISAFKVPNEILVKPKQFVMRHAASGALEYIDHDSVPYLGYIPQDVIGKDALKLYHPDDLCYMGQAYETIVKEGGLSKSKPYRMRAQNDDYVKLETEWTSFINPWSRKLEFVVGKHSVLEGPSNPDVLQTVETSKKTTKVNEEAINKQQAQRDSIIKILNGVLTKSAGVAKLQMTKRCQDLATFMETLIEEKPKAKDELRLKIQDSNSYCEDKMLRTSTPMHSKMAEGTVDENRRSAYTGKRTHNERDSMLGGISPHQDLKDSKSTETPLSYNQLNYNENLQRYFDSHQSISQEDLGAVIGENALGFKGSKPMSLTCLSPIALQPADSGEVASSCESGLTGFGSSTGVPCGDYQSMKLTESLLTKHNSDMEKELLRVRRQMRSSCKARKEKTCVDYKQKKKEHITRCNASFQPAAVATASPLETHERKTHGVKRPSQQADSESVAHKHHCPMPRQTPQRHESSAQQTASTTTGCDDLAAASHVPLNQVNKMNAFILGVGIPQPMPIITPVMPGIIPMYYAPANTMTPTNSGVNDPNKINSQLQAPTSIIPMYYGPATSMTPTNSGVNDPNKINSQLQAPTMQCMMYGQGVYGSPLVYSPMASEVAIPAQQSMSAQSVQCTNTLRPLGLASSNYEEACKLSVPLKQHNTFMGWREKRRMEARASSSKDIFSADSSTSSNALNRACKPSVPLKQHNTFMGWREKRRMEARAASSKDIFSADSSTSSNALNRDSGANSSSIASRRKLDGHSSDLQSSTHSYIPKSTEAVPGSESGQDGRLKTVCTRTSEEANDRTDGESSYSSFYSSFFKTESGSADDSGDPKERGKLKISTTSSDFWGKNHTDDQSSVDDEAKKHNNVPRRKMKPPWMEQVSVTSELIYKYQILTKTMEEVLSADKQKIENLPQPALVNEQLGQLYLDLQLEGVASRLTLEEGVTSSSSSGEDTCSKPKKETKRKREYSKLMMIYEEDAPLPPPSTDDEMTPSPTT